MLATLGMRQLGSEAAAAREARLEIAKTVGADHPAYEDLRLVVSELVTNAFRHGPPDGRITLHIRREEGDFLIEVADDGTSRPRPILRAPDPEVNLPEKGLGLWNVHVITLGRWGFQDRRGLPGCVVWARIPAHPHR
ncbi:ATP-binding protein [Streptosporangium sp. NPDC020072]|uniref:ATP-binding protein n=1 Tax=Streptosporangium sp. NPDC020072 TaxID=3154788 RepID=UPI00342D12FC